MNRINLIFAIFILGSLTSCGGPHATKTHAPGLGVRKGVVEVEPIESSRVIAGQTIYVPAYSLVFTADQADGWLCGDLSIPGTPTHSSIYP